MCINGEVLSLVDCIPDVPIMEGKVINIDTILNIPIVFTKWSIGDSKWKDNKGNTKPLLTLQFEWEGRTRIVWTSSKPLIKQIKAFNERYPDATCFKASIHHVDNKFYKFFA